MHAAIMQVAPNTVLPPILSPKHSQARMVANTGSIVNIIVVSAFKSIRRLQLLINLQLNIAENTSGE